MNMNMTGRNVIELKNRPAVIASASAVGKTEGEGPLKDEYDIIFSDDKINSGTWESAESELIKSTVEKVFEKSSVCESDVGLIFAGDLLNQCTASTYGLKDFGIPYAGIYGACSTMASALCLASMTVDSGYCSYAAACTSSHFCSAEKQFRYPLEYGGQRTPSSQRTVTGAGAFIIGRSDCGIRINRIMFGKIIDMGVTDTSNMGAAMAPAAAYTIYKFMQDTETVPEDYSMILTGDLGKVGSDLLKDIMISEYGRDISSVHNDCGLMIYDIKGQSVNSGGSGCGCSAAVTASYIMNQMKECKLKKVLFAGTGALMSPLLSLQGESIPAVAHAVEFSL